MSGLSTGVGLISGLNTAEIINALITAQRAPAARIESRIAGFQSTQTGLKTLEAFTVSITSSIQSLGNSNLFNSFTVNNPNSSNVAVSTGTNSIPGTYHFTPLADAQTHAAHSKGFVNADQQTIGSSGTVTIATGGHLHRSTPLDVLNSGTGVRRGTIRVSDRAGNSSDIDLSNVHSVDDVLAAINNDATISVTASTINGQIVLEDTTGSTTSNLSVVDLNGNFAAADLGIAQSVTSDTLTGSDVFAITTDFTLGQINDGNGLRLVSGAPDIKLTLADATEIEVTLDSAATIGDVINTINNHADNGGKVTAALVSGALQLTDNTSGGGTFTVENINDSSAIRQLGIDSASSGGVISGRRLVAGINSVLLANLRGGQGIDEVGSISLTDRAGTSTTINLSSAQSLDEVIHAINTAENGGIDLQLSARINNAGTGIVVTDTSGATASNLIIADVATGTLAEQLGIEVDAAQTSIDSGSLNHRYLNESTSVADYAPDGSGIAAGSIRIVDSAGNEEVIAISSAVATIGDVLQRINAASKIQVTAQLNTTGDGFELIDNAGGSGGLRVEEIDSTTAADLRILGTGTLNATSGKYEITSRQIAEIDVESDDTLNDLIDKFNAFDGTVSAAVIDDGSTFSSKRLAITSAISGAGGRLIIDDGALNLGFSTFVEGRDARLRVGADPLTGFIATSSTNAFEETVADLSATVVNANGTTAEVSVTRDDSKITSSLQSFVTAYNALISNADEQTSFDIETEERGVLQGQGVVLRILSRVESIVSQQYGDSTDTIRSLSQLGIRFTTGGKLTLDTEELQSAIDNDPATIEKFFTNTDNGFSDAATNIVESLTDPFTGTFTLENTSLQDSIDSLQDRVDTLDEILLVRRDRLLQEFVRMEELIAGLQTQQQAISAIAPITVNRRSNNNSR